MVRLSRPSAELIERYRTERTTTAPTFDSNEPLPPGFHFDRQSIDLGHGLDTFAGASAALRGWQAHLAAGVTPSPTSADIATGATVALVTRQLGLWILAACRITATVDTDRSFGFTYATLPDHPECGEESFTVMTHDDGRVDFVVAATSRPAANLAKLGAPVSRTLQRRTMNRYLNGLAAALQTPR